MNLAIIMNLDTVHSVNFTVATSDCRAALVPMFLPVGKYLVPNKEVFYAFFMSNLELPIIMIIMMIGRSNKDG